MEDELNLSLFDTGQPVRAGILLSIMPDCVSPAPTRNGIRSRLDCDSRRVAIAVHERPDIAGACRIKIPYRDEPESIRTARRISASQSCANREAYQNPSCVEFWHIDVVRVRETPVAAFYRMRCAEDKSLFSLGEFPARSVVGRAALGRSRTEAHLEKSRLGHAVLVYPHVRGSPRPVARLFHHDIQLARFVHAKEDVQAVKPDHGINRGKRGRLEKVHLGATSSRCIRTRIANCEIYGRQSDASAISASIREYGGKHTDYESVPRPNGHAHRCVEQVKPDLRAPSLLCEGVGYALVSIDPSLECPQKAQEQIEGDEPHDDRYQQNQYGRTAESEVHLADSSKGVCVTNVG